MLTLAAAVVAFQPGLNLSFEQASGQGPVGWRQVRYAGEAAFGYADTARTGRRSVLIRSDQGADASWSADFTVRPFSRYRLSAWVRTEAVEPIQGGRGALINLHGIEGAASQPVTGTQNWQRVSFEFDSGRRDAVRVNALFGGWGRAKGSAWFDDFSLEQLSTADPKLGVVVDASRRSEPISPYIYGQFIEHMGRCIYGGIWAEMLEDRKFLHAAGSTDSPWRFMGGGSMDTESPYVGSQTPRLPAGAELVQDQLELKAGMSYEGRVVLEGEGSVSITLEWEGGRSSTKILNMTGGWYKHPFELRAEKGGPARLVLRAEAPLRVGTVSLMPADNVSGFRPEVLKLLKELDSPVYRWPGGNFVSGYNWRDGIGDRDRRPPRRNPAWTGIESNDVGMHEFIELCRILETEPFIAVNTGLGTPEEAAAEVEYANAPADQGLGRLRALNGDAEPFRVKWWAVGNEMYGDWQLGHMPLADNVKKHRLTAELMKGKDPSVQLIGVGAVGNWSRTMLSEAADQMELISEHFYNQEAAGLLAHVSQPADTIRSIAAAHRQYRQQIPGLAARDIRIAMDEWNYWYGPHVYGELGTKYFLKDALGIAAGLHEFFRHSDIIFMANYAQTVNVIGAIKTTKTEAYMDTTGEVLKLYRQRFAEVPVAVEGEMGVLDVSAAVAKDGSRLTLGIVNGSMIAADLPVDIKGFSPAAGTRSWIITGPDPMATNEPGQPPAVTIQPWNARWEGGRLAIPPMSVVVVELRRG